MQYNLSYLLKYDMGESPPTGIESDLGRLKLHLFSLLGRGSPRSFCKLTREGAEESDIHGHLSRLGVVQLIGPGTLLYRVYTK